MRSSTDKGIKIVFRDTEVNIDAVQNVLWHVAKNVFGHFNVDVSIS